MQEWLKSTIVDESFGNAMISSINKVWVFYVFIALGSSKNAFWECADSQHLLSIASARGGAP